MNLREGTRRLALLLGLLGGSVGCFASYVEYQDVSHQRKDNQQFEQLASSDFVRQERQYRQAGFPAIPNSQSQYVRLPDGKIGRFPLDAPDVEIRAAIEKQFPGTYKKKGTSPERTENANQIAETVSDTWDNYTGGVRAIRWTEDFSVSSFETEDGRTLFLTPAPGAWSDALIVIFPFLGFLVPWGLVRGIGWVAVGFSHDQPSQRLPQREQFARRPRK